MTSPPRPHHGPDGRFRNPWPGGEIQGLPGLLRWGLHRMIRRRGPARAVDPALFRSVQPNLSDPNGSPLDVTWLGHSTVLIRTPAATVLTDPVWAERVSPFSFLGPRRWVPAPLALEALPRLDLVLLSHNHYDHLDQATVRRLAELQPGAPWVMPLGLSATLRGWGVRDAIELDWWDVHRAGVIEIGCAPAMHFSARGFRDRNQTLWCGWSIRLGERRAFFAGDTGYHPEFPRIRERFGPFDLLMLPVGAYEPRWFMRPVHMNPEEAVLAYRDLVPDPAESAGVMVPIHWGTYRLTDEPMDEPPGRTREAWRGAGLPEERLWILQHGETRQLR
ncbi:MAG TPA: MBL fold metallo-hydrolase [Gemmatimonadales bacterium]|nr:MBL fold metallo-hydrolase [Gemmatimonadales bacterium]